MIRARGIAAILVLLLTLSPVPAEGITYGDFVDSPQVEYPEVVPVWAAGALCSGTLIEQQIVLTAAHCIYGRSGPIQVAVGGSTLNSGRLIDVTAAWYHPRYDASFLQNDIAILFLKEAAGVSRVASLPRATARKPKNFTMAGWGDDQNGRLTGNLSALNLNDQGSVAAKVFRGTYNPRTMIGAGRFFANEALYGGGCEGDSGGPLYRGINGSSRVVVGVTSWGAEGCIQYKPTIFTWVSYYVPELRTAMAVVRNRALRSPLPTGRATPAGVGPTSTTISSTTTSVLRTTTTSVLRTTPTIAATTTTTAAMADFVLSSWNGQSAYGTTATNTAWIEACFFVNNAPWVGTLGFGGGQTPVVGTHCVKNDYLDGWNAYVGRVVVAFSPYGYKGKYACTYGAPCDIYVVISDARGRSVTSPKASLVLP